MKWLARHRFSDRPVRLQKSGVGIISKYPLDTINTDDVIGPCSAAVAQTPIGSMLAGSTHLKCCGAIGGCRDQRRKAEAHAIQPAVVNLPEEKRQMVVLGGDINLVGSRDPLDLMAERLDADDTDLPPAQAPTPGASAFYTRCWEAPSFAPGPLDWNLYCESTLEVVNAFVTDTTRLSKHSLSAYELEREDSRASDHLLLGVDVPKR